MKKFLYGVLILAVVALTASAALAAKAADGGLAAYKSVFDDLKRQIKNEEYDWNGVAEASGSAGFTLSGYRCLLRDMNSDGVDELFLFSKLDDDFILIAVFTMTKGKPELLKEFWSRSSGYLTTGNYIVNEWSNGAADSGVSVYKFSKGNGLVVADGYEERYDEDAEKTLTGRYETSDGRIFFSFDDEAETEKAVWRSMSKEELNKIKDNPDYNADVSIEPLPIPE
jgi:hypothetical protein